MPPPWITPTEWNQRKLRLPPKAGASWGCGYFWRATPCRSGPLLAGYAIMRGNSANWPVPVDVLGISLTAFMTFLLICSSVTMVKGLDAIKNDDQAGLVKYMWLTVGGGRHIPRLTSL